MLPIKNDLKRLYDCTIEDLQVYTYTQVKYDFMHHAPIVFLYDHRWFINLQRQNLPMIDINPHIKALSEAYNRLKAQQKPFQARFCVPVNSQAYEDMYGEIAKEALNSNLINLYNGTFELIEKGKTSQLDFYNFFIEAMQDNHIVSMELI